jgi:hypothetical protein
MPTCDSKEEKGQKTYEFRAPGGIPNDEVTNGYPRQGY